jgi:hypothetical protein
VTILEDHIPDFDHRFGPAFSIANGPLDVIVLAYWQPLQTERFYYAKGIGWIKWEAYDRWGRLKEDPPGTVWSFTFDEMVTFDDIAQTPGLPEYDFAFYESFACVYSRPQCADGLDNDQDGFIDLGDPNCTGPDDDAEKAPGTGCGLGFELVFVLGALRVAWCWRRSRASPAL